MKFFILAVIIIDLIVGGLLAHFGLQAPWTITVPTLTISGPPTFLGITLPDIWNTYGLGILTNFVIFIWNILATIVGLIAFQVPNVNPIINGIFDVMHLAVVIALIPWG